MCSNFKDRIVKIDNMNVNLVHEERIMNLCDKYEVENTQGGDHMMMLDPGAPVSLAERPWLSKYLAVFDFKIEYTVPSACYQVF